MSVRRFYRCEEVRCPKCGAQLKYLTTDKVGEPLLMQHPVWLCRASGKKFYAAPLVVELEEFKD